MNLDVYVWNMLQKIVKPTALLFEVSTGWTLLFYAGITVLTYYRLKESKK